VEGSGFKIHGRQLRNTKERRRTEKDAPTNAAVVGAPCKAANLARDAAALKTRARKNASRRSCVGPNTGQGKVTNERKVQWAPCRSQWLNRGWKGRMLPAAAMRRQSARKEAMRRGWPV
jgi:hypothetical protein